MKTYRFQNAPLLTAFSKRPGFSHGFARRRVNGWRNRIESYPVTNELNRVHVNGALACTWLIGTPA